MSSTDLDLDTIEARVNAASPGPWRQCGNDRGGCQCCMVWSLPHDLPVADTRTAVGSGDRENTEEQMRADAAFIAHAREDITALLAEVRRLRAANTP